MGGAHSNWRVGQALREFEFGGAALFAGFAKGAVFQSSNDHRSRLLRRRIGRAHLPLAKLVEPMTAPRPQLRVRDQPSLRRIHVHVVQLLDSLFLAPHVEVLMQRTKVRTLCPTRKECGTRRTILAGELSRWYHALRGGSEPGDRKYRRVDHPPSNAPNMLNRQTVELGNSLGVITGTQLPVAWNTSPGQRNNEPGTALINCYNGKK